MFQRLSVIFVFSMASACSEAPEDGGSAGEGSGDGGDKVTCSTAFDCAAGEICGMEGLCAQASVCASDEECGSGAFCNPEGACTINSVGSTCSSDAECGNQSCLFGFCGCEGTEVAAEAVPPNVVVLMDRSGSMTWAVSNTDPAIRWNVASQSLSSVVNSFDSSARLGYAAYPQGNINGNCTVSAAADVAPTVGAASAIESQMSQHPAAAGNGTPTLQILTQAAAGTMFTPDLDRENYLLLVTDGEPSCHPAGWTDEDLKSGIEAEVAKLANGSIPVKTYAIGFGEGVGHDFLQRVAIAGQTNQAFSTKDSTSLTAALDEVMGKSVSCTFSLPDEWDPAQVVVNLDGNPVDADAENGYSIEGELLKVHGASCDILRSSPDKKLNILTGCTVTID